MYTVMINGVSVQCDTAAAALELAREAGSNDGEGPRHAPSRHHGGADPAASEGASRWTEQRLHEFFRNIKTQQRKLVDALYDAPDGRTSDQLLQHLGLDGGAALAGVFSGLWKNARKVGANPKEVYERQTVEIGDKRQYEYSLAESFRAAVKKHGKGKG